MLHLTGFRLSGIPKAVLLTTCVVLVFLLVGAGQLVAASGESGQALDGTLIVRQGDDLVHHRVTDRSFALAVGHDELDLAFDGAAPDYEDAGARVRVHGAADERQFRVADGGTQQVAGTVSTTAAAVGTKRLAVVLVNFSNDQSQPYTSAFAAGVAFTNANSVAAYYAESSWNQLTLTGNVFGWYTISSSNATCSPSVWATAATQAAATAGVDLSGYGNVVYAFPSVAACGWSGLGDMPGRNSWLNGPVAMNLATMAHELGHNFGTHHAQTLSCTENGVRVALSADLAKCSVDEYGDPFTIMGGAGRYEFTSFSRGNLGWLQPANMLTVSASGDYVIAPLDTQSTAVSSLRIQRTASTYLTLEFRQPSGASFDTFAPTAPVVNGVSVRITPDYSSRTQSKLIDTHPSTATFTDAPLAPGETFTDPLTGVSIVTKSVSSTGAVVHVALGSAPPPTPTASTTPLSTVSPAPIPTATPLSLPTASPAPSPTAAPAATASLTPTLTDGQPPTAPASLTAVVGKSRKVSLAWNASADNIGVAGYRVYRDGTPVATVTNTSWVDPQRASGTPRTYYVVAFDAAGNVSPPSNSVSGG